MTIHNLEGNFDQLWKDQSWGSYTEWPHFRSSILIYSTLLSLFSSTMTSDFVFSDLADPSVVSKGAETFSFRFYSNGWEKERSRDLLLSPESFQFHSQILSGNQQWAFEAPIWRLSAVKWSFLFFFSVRERKTSFGFFNDWGEYTLNRSITSLVIGKMGKPLGRGRKQHMQTVYRYVES